MIKQNKREPALTDTDRMPFGKYKGEPLSDVPASYLSWLWNQDGFGKAHSRNLSEEDQKKYPIWIFEKIKLANYIWNSQDAIAQEIGDTFI